MSGSWKFPDSALNEALEVQGPQVLGIFGRPSCHATARVLDALSNASNVGNVVYLKGGLPPSKTLRQRMAKELTRLSRTTDVAPSWAELVRAAALDPAVYLVLDEAQEVAEADRRFLTEIAEGRRRSLAEGGVPRLALISDDRRFLRQLSGPKSPFYDSLGALTDKRVEAVTPIEMGALSYGALAELCPTWPAADVLRGFAVFGGTPQVLGVLDPTQSLRWNVTHHILSPTGALFDLPARSIKARFQKPGRYYALLLALANGARIWQEVAHSSPEFGSGSQMGAYMRRLEERGFMGVLTSLDAEPESRRKRYLLMDPYEAFWFRFVSPLSDALSAGQKTPDKAWEETIAPALDRFTSQILPRVANQYLSHHASRRLGSDTRVSGGLWGEDYDFDAAATLMDGSVAYGHCTWLDRAIGEGAIARTRREMRETRYGFGRERRTVMLFMKEPPTPELEHAALRDPNVEWIDAERLVADARQAYGTASVV